MFWSKLIRRRPVLRVQWLHVAKVRRQNVELDVWKNPLRPDGAVRLLTISRFRGSFLYSEISACLLETDLDDLIEAARAAKRQLHDVRSAS
jgi:hypothetical protein